MSDFFWIEEKNTAFNTNYIKKAYIDRFLPQEDPDSCWNLYIQFQDDTEIYIRFDTYDEAKNGLFVLTGLNQPT